MTEINQPSLHKNRGLRAATGPILKGGMLANPWSSICKRCPQPTRLLVLPLVLFFLLGLLVHTNILHYPSNAPDVEVCLPRNNVVFLKTHKCAGSSIQNIFLRYGDAHGLTFALPRSSSYLGHPQPFNRTMVARPQLPSYNMLVHHTRLDYDEVRAVVPSDSVFVTIVRNPLNVFESIFSYYNLGHSVGGDIHLYLDNARFLTGDLRHRRLKRKFGTNQMMFDLGADPGIFDDDALVRQYVDRLDGWFDLVLVADRMDESLVLLRHLLCWGVDQVVTFRLNARASQFVVSNLTQDERARLRQINRADVLLYEHFLKKFDSEVEAFGRHKMAEEVEVLRERSRAWYKLCVLGEEKSRTSKGKPKLAYSPKVMVFKTDAERNSTCGRMTKKPVLYTSELRKRQIASAGASSKGTERDTAGAGPTQRGLEANLESRDQPMQTRRKI